MTPDEYVEIGHRNEDEDSDDEQLESENQLDEDHTPESGNIQEYLILNLIKHEEEAPIPNNTSPQTCKAYAPGKKTVFANVKPMFILGQFALVYL
ncbi:hypothetical protein DAPPUDRAFT_266068 [Daphnia pulex]|uniref:Uncharacterized protein n=1 Tax=Daphnia pulex TaxID=6669 RepID=E9HUF4_DAPPU|nr:hypothetical protein DAPPUDRAFT_266068 [Daphnia pulex]|eukprot:EFX64626.1 hypothetical protein DAPPUDRAFT_266068 [Daphnia pulex]